MASKMEGHNICDESVYNTRMEELKDTVATMNLHALDIQPEDMFDEFCDPAKPVKVAFNDISAAAYRIKGGVYITPCVVSEL